MSWLARLELHARRDGARCIVHAAHTGPLRVLKTLYPEGAAIAHQVLVHPPGGIVGGDRLELDVRADAGAHLLLTTPGATRFYRSAGDEAVQQVRLRLADGARLEWLPLESIAHRGCIAENRLTIELADGAEMFGWDVLALGLPASGESYDGGRFVQQLEIPGVWLERGRIHGDDTLLLDSPLGLGGKRVLATLWFAAGRDLAPARREALLDAGRALLDTPLAGITAPNARVVVLRALADRVEPAMRLLQAVRSAWRRQAWALAGEAPRIWRT